MVRVSHHLSVMCRCLTDGRDADATAESPVKTETEGDDDGLDDVFS